MSRMAAAHRMPSTRPAQGHRIHAGGGATIDAEGKVKAPTYTVKGLDGKDGTYSDVGSAVDALNANMSNIAPNLKYMKFGVSDAAQAQASGTDAVAIGGNAFAMGEHAIAIGRKARAQEMTRLPLVSGRAYLWTGGGLRRWRPVTKAGSVAIGYNSWPMNRIPCRSAARPTRVESSMWPKASTTTMR